MREYKRHTLCGVLAAVVIATASVEASASDPKGEDWLTEPLAPEWMTNDHFAPTATLPTDDNWWRNFEDPTLDSLIYLGETNNFDLAQAARRIEIARLAIKQARSGYYPTIGLDLGWTHQRISGAMSGSDVSATTTGGFTADLSMSWEIDLFGKVTSRVNREKTLYKASRAEYASAMVSLCGEIASAYVDLRVYQALLEVAQQHIESQQKIVKITEAREEAGISSMLDVSQAYTVYYSTLATVPSIETSIHTTLTALCVLMGEEPGRLDHLLTSNTELPNYNAIMSVGVPMDLLRRRPDVVAAELAIQSDADALGIAKKDYLPTLSLTGSIGTGARNISNLMKKNSFTYSIAPTLSWTVFDGLSRRYAVASAREQMQVDIDNYNLTVLTAVKEVDNSMFTYLESLKYIDNLQKVVESSGKSLNYSVDLYKRGLSQFYNVVEAQTSVLNYENDLVQAKGQALQALISIYKALGGGWAEDSL
ncbi:MAG: TolC family protein [Bacteroides sp.]|nr:TolC family protein [Bacteroides sp.]MCM1413379.1 TolC family protein [Bacteroides sp.]MCM1471935.1 TolC family protein [Bacteroides sp.]